jgi:hypothetical protein
VDAAALDEHPDLVARLLADDLDGVTVRGVYPRDAVARACRDLEAHLADATPVAFGTILGRPLYQGGVDVDPAEHFDDADRVRPIYRQLFGFDPHERLGEVLAPALGGLPWSTPTRDHREYLPGNLRHMEPGLGGLKAHSGNQFLVSEADGALGHLMTTTRAFDHMSYFVVLQPPEVGGTLSVFEKLWEPPSEEEAQAIPLGDDRAFDEIPHLKVAPDAGDLILFNAGHRWHRVDDVGGNVARITYGGFAAPDTEGTALHCWC